MIARSALELADERSGVVMPQMRAFFALTLAIASAGASVAITGSAHAAACCGSGHGLGNRLTTIERAAVLFNIRETERIGVWSSVGDFTPPRDSQFERELRLEAGFITRVANTGLGRRFSLGLVVPVMYTWKQVGGGATGSGGGVGDIAASGRFDLPALFSSAPDIALSFSASAPTGRPSRDAQDQFKADITGLGAAELRPGVSIEKTWMEGWFATVAGSVGFRTSQLEHNGSEVELSPRYQLIAAAGPIWSSFSMNFGALFEYETGPRIDGNVGAATTKYRTAALAFAAYDITANWTAFAAALVDIPISNLGRNEPATVSPAIGARYAWGNRD